MDVYNPAVEQKSTNTPQQETILTKPIRKKSKKALEVEQILFKLGYVRNVTLFEEWSDEGRMRYILPLRIDEFASPERLGFEVDGVQHFDERGFYYTQEEFITVMTRDMNKDKYCLENRISLLRIPYNMPYDKTVETIKYVINLCKQGHHVYASYKHYYYEVIKTINMDISNTMISFIKCPKIKFKTEIPPEINFDNAIIVNKRLDEINKIETLFNRPIEEWLLEDFVFFYSISDYYKKKLLGSGASDDAEFKVDTYFNQFNILVKAAFLGKASIQALRPISSVESTIDFLSTLSTDICLLNELLIKEYPNFKKNPNLISNNNRDISLEYSLKRLQAMVFEIANKQHTIWPNSDNIASRILDTHASGRTPQDVENIRYNYVPHTRIVHYYSIHDPIFLRYIHKKF